MAGEGGSFIIKNVPSRENKNLESSKLVDHLKVIFTGFFCQKYLADSGYSTNTIHFDLRRPILLDRWQIHCI